MPCRAFTVWHLGLCKLLLHRSQGPKENCAICQVFYDFCRVNIYIISNFKAPIDSVQWGDCCMLSTMLGCTADSGIWNMHSKHPAMKIQGCPVGRRMYGCHCGQSSYENNLALDCRLHYRIWKINRLDSRMWTNRDWGSSWLSRSNRGWRCRRLCHKSKISKAGQPIRRSPGSRWKKKSRHDKKRRQRSPAWRQHQCPCVLQLQNLWGRRRWQQLK